jgi:hypothetical protein
MKKKEPKVYLKQLNWDEECEADFLLKRGIHITEQSFNKDQKNLHGSHSPMFNSDCPSVTLYSNI